MPVSQLNAREIDLFNTDHIKRIVAEVDNEQNRRRKRDAWKLKQCLEGNQAEYVKKELAVLYPKTHNKFRVGDINIVGKVDNKVSASYKNQPIRKTESTEEDKSLTEIYDGNHFGRSFTEADSIYNMHKYTCMWLTWQNPDTDKGIDEFKYVLHSLAPFEYDLIRDQVTGEPLVFIQNYPESTITGLAGKSDGIEQTISESQSDTSAQTRVYTFWNKNQYAKVIVKKAKGNGNEAQEQVNVNFIEKKGNVLGMLPIVYLQKDTAVDYPVKQNLGNQSVNWNVSFSDLKTASAAQGHGQLVVQAPEGQKQKTYHMGMHTAIFLPQSKKPDAPSTDAKYISASPDLTGQLDVLKFDVTNILDDHGVKAKGSIEGGAEKFASGLDRVLSEADVQSTIEGNQSLYVTTLEQGVFTLVKKAEEVMNQKTFSKTESLKVTFEKPKVLISDAETLANIKSRDEQGLILDWEKHIILNPNLTEDQAKKREEEIQAQKAKKLAEMKATMGTEFEDEEDEETEDFVDAE